jgi:hydroxyacylglutathione hydrolase
MQIIRIPVIPFAQNCRIIACSETKQAIVVDPGGYCR